MRSLVLAPLMMLTAAACWAAPTSAPPMRDALWSPEFATSLKQLDQVAAWPIAERKAYADLVAGAHTDWLLAPTQVQMRGFGVAERSAVTAMLAQDLADAGIIVPSTFLVERALGDGHRVLAPEAIDALAQKVGAANIILPYIGQDGAGHLTLSLVVYRKSTLSTPMASQIPRWFTWKGIGFSDEAPPLVAIAGLRGEILQSLGFTTPSATEALASAKSFVIPASPEALVAQDKPTPVLDNAAALAIFAVLTPPTTRGSDRLYERTLLAALRAPASPEQRFLTSYALFRLGMRPNALRILEGDHSAALTALKAVVNGNLTGTDALVRRTSGYQRFILEIELHDLACWYQHDASGALPKNLSDLSARSDWWATLIQARWNDYTPGADLDSRSLKTLLDRHFALPGQSLEDMIAGRAITPGLRLTEADVQMSVLQHVRGVLARDQASLCCLHSPLQVNVLDLLSVVEAWSTWQVIRSIDLDLDMRDSPEQALQRTTALDPVYAGLPEYEFERAKIENSLAGKSSGPSKQVQLEHVQAHVMAGLMEAGGQTPEGSEAIALVYMNPLATKLAADYLQDLPYDPDWFGIDPAKDRQPDNLLALRQALANTDINAGYLDTLLQIGGDSVKGEVAAALHDRFLGSPLADNVRDKLKRQAAGPDAALQIMQARVRAAPDVWDHRINLGDYLVLHGDYAEALQVFVSFPGFGAGSKVNPIELSNDAQEAGHLFYWHGALPQARKLFAISMSYGTGSEAEIVSAMETALIDHNLAAALAQAYRRAGAYPSGSSYSNYLSLLHIIGHSQEAWKSFNVLAGQSLGLGLWDSATVGLRIRGTTPAQLDQWLTQPPVGQSQAQGVTWRTTFLLNWSITDREGSPDLVAQMRAMGQEPEGITEDRIGKYSSFPSDDPNSRPTVPRSDFRSDQRPLLKVQSPIDSSLVAYSAGLLAMQHGDFAGAVSHFDEVAAHFTIERYIDPIDAAYALPDFAYASAKADDPLSLEPFLAKLPNQVFEGDLALAYFQGIRHHDTTAALQSLKKAFGRIDNVVGRWPSMQYQYAETAERLYKDTHAVQFRDLAVSWAHTVQTLQPWTAWAYAMEAELAETAAQRSAVLDKAYFLDPLSPRLRAIPAAELEQARRRISSGGSPFKLPSNSAAQPIGGKTAQTLRFVRSQTTG
jgi:hypothetical protein